MGYMIAAYVVGVGGIAVYGIYLAVETRRLRRQLDADRQA